MAKSSIALLLLWCLPPPAWASGPATPDQAIEAQKAQLREAIGLDCPREEGEIVVCGRGGPDPNRVPFPNQRVPGERARLGPGEAPSGLAGLSAGQSPCTTVGANSRCGGGLPVFQTAIVLVKIARHLIDPED